MSVKFELDHVGWQGVMHGIHGLFNQMTDLLFVSVHDRLVMMIKMQEDNSCCR